MENDIDTHVPCWLVCTYILGDSVLTLRSVCTDIEIRDKHLTYLRRKFKDEGRLERVMCETTTLNNLYGAIMQFGEAPG